MLKITCITVSKSIWRKRDRATAPNPKQRNKTRRGNMFLVLQGEHWSHDGDTKTGSCCDMACKCPSKGVQQRRIGRVVTTKASWLARMWDFANQHKSADNRIGDKVIHTFSCTLRSKSTENMLQIHQQKLLIYDVELQRFTSNNNESNNFYSHLGYPRPRRCCL